MGIVCEPFFTLGGGACGLHTSGTGGRARRIFFLCAAALVFFHLHFSRSLWGAGGVSASLLSAAALVVCIQAVREGGRAEIRLCASALVSTHLHFPRCVLRAGGPNASLLSAAALVVCIQAVREG